MQRIVYNGPVDKNERETLIIYDVTTNMWHATTSLRKHYSSLLRKNWELVKLIVNSHGHLVEAEFVAPANAITFRDVLKLN